MLLYILRANKIDPSYLPWNKPKFPKNQYMLMYNKILNMPKTENIYKPKSVEVLQPPGCIFLQKLRVNRRSKSAMHLIIYCLRRFL